MLRIGLICRQFRKYCTTNRSEMKYLNVAEKNDAAKTIAGFLSNGSARRREGYSVYNKIYEFETTVRGQNAKMVMTSVSGHLMTHEFVSSYRNWTTCDPQQLFDAPIRKACIKDNEPIKRTLEREVKSCQALIIWTDCDREGENIGFEIIDVCKAIKPNLTVYRAKFSEITAIAARRALANLTQPDKKQSEAVEVRSILDLRTGAAFTRFQTLRLQRIFPAQIAEKLISYGSCQIPTLGFVAARYKEAEEFVSEPFWKLKVTHTIDDLTVEFTWARNRLFDKELCEDYLLVCLADPLANVESVVTKPKNKWRPVALDTVELEKLGSRKLKINAKTVLNIAEKLYQQGFISYPRTETNKFSKEINLRGLVENHTSHPEWGPFALRVMEWGANPRNGNKSDEAHPPIHPLKCATGLSGDELRIYELVTRHFLACVSKDATGSETIVNINIAGEKFSANGLVIFERNYLDVYPYEKWNAKQIHRYEMGQTFEPTEITMQEGATTAPPLLTEADLIALMDKHGIGTDATHAEHINTIKERGYIGEVERGFLVPGTIGMGLYEGYHAIELPLAEPVLRAEFEVDLKKICSGEKNPQDVLNDQICKYKEAYRVLAEKCRALDEQLAKRLNEIPQQGEAPDPPPVIRTEEVLPCPKCTDSSLLLKQKKDSTSLYLTCARYPDCKNAIWFSDDIKSVKVTDSTCNKCGPKYRLLEFKFKQMNYLALLNASGLTYSTCIVCDNKFRELFDINLERIKRVGAIVSDQNAPNQANRNTSNTIRNATTNTNNRRTGQPLNRNNNSNQRPPPYSRSNSTAAPSDHQPNNISRYRGWGSFDSNNDSRPASLSNNIVSETTNVDPFGENLDEMFFNDDWDFGTNTSENVPARQQSTNDNRSAGSNHNSNRNSNWPSISWGTSGNSERSSENSGGGSSTNTATNLNSSWGSLNNNRSSSTGRSPYGSNTKRPPIWAVNNNQPRVESVAWGSAGSSIERNVIDDHEPREGDSEQRTINCPVCKQAARSLTVRKDGPNKGRQFYACKTECSFFQWADEAQNTNSGAPNFARDSGRWSQIRANTQTINILCSCNRPANERTVRKYGPNKGRQFYVCTREGPSCDFFKWADENAQPNGGQPWGSASNNDAASSWGTGRNNNTGRDQPSTSWGTNPPRSKQQGSASNSSENQPAKKRKCGLCRQEGHTKLKCPRKEEFGDY